MLSLPHGGNEVAMWADKDAVAREHACVEREGIGVRACVRACMHAYMCVIGSTGIPRHSEVLRLGI